MFRSIFTKTLYGKRWTTVAWALGLGALVVFTMLFFPTFQEVGQSFKDVPESLKAFLGDATTYSSIAGFTDLQIFNQYVFMTLVLGVVLFTGLLAGEEGSGTLQILLVQPVSRTRVYWEKVLAGMVVIAAVSLAISFSAWLGAVIVGETLRLDRLATATVGVWLITMVFSSIGYALGAVWGRRGLAGALAGVLAFVAYLVSSLAESVESLQAADKLSPFHYFNRPGILSHGVDWSDFALLAVLTIVPLLVAHVLFVRRDIYQR